MYRYSSCGKHLFHYYLRFKTERVSETHWKSETVTSLEGIPEGVIDYTKGEYYLKVNCGTTKLEKPNE
jgi:hypothetical protein